jgi:hypothetical protein
VKFLEEAMAHFQGYEPLALVTLTTHDLLEGNAGVTGYGERMLPLYGAAAMGFACPLGGTALSAGQVRVSTSRQEFDFTVWDVSPPPVDIESFAHGPATGPGPH